MAVSVEHGLVLYQAMAITTRGWALIEPGREHEAIEEMRGGLAALDAIRAQLLRPHFLAMLAGALEQSGQAAEAFRLLDEALAAADSTGERYYQAELYRLKGEQLLSRATPHAARLTVAGTGTENGSPAPDSAEGCFNRALEIARQQQALSLELRAAMSLARLYRDRGEQAQARALLGQAYGSFTEGFETVDLREAKALLDQLT